MTFSYWIQKHDYTSEDVSNVTVHEAIAAYARFDWQGELAAYDENDEDRSCPPGIGVHNGFDGKSPDTMLLHICPRDATTVFLNFHRKSQKRVLGIWSTTKDDVRYAECVSGTLVPDLIQDFFTLDQEPILRHCD